MGHLIREDGESFENHGMIRKFPLLQDLLLPFPFPCHSRLQLPRKKLGSS
jgi:hypothetical protein